MKCTISFRNKFILNTVLVVLFALTFSGIYFIYIYYTNLKAETFSKIDFTMQQTSYSLHNKLMQLDNCSFALLASKSLRNWSQGDISFSTEDPDYFLHLQDLLDEVSHNLMFNNAWVAKYIDAIYLFTDDTPIRLCTRLPYSPMLMNAEFEQVYQDTLSNPNMSFYSINHSSEEPQIYLLRRMQDISQQKQATLIFSLNESELSKELYTTDFNMEAHLLYKDTILLSNSPDLIGTTVDQSTLLSSSSTSFVQTQQLSLFPFSIYISISHNSIYGPLIHSLVPYILFMVISLFIFGTLTGFITNSYTKFIKDLLLNIGNMRQSDFNTLMPYYTDHDLNQISLTFNQMTQEINHLINCVYHNELLLKEADIKLLQSQISPHFLINTLTTIGVKAMLKGDSEIYQMTSSLSTMLDASMHNTLENSGFVKLSQELEYINCYLTLQQIRFSDKLNFKIHIHDPALTSLYILRLSIEPFVENAVIHGLEGNLQSGQIIIEIFQENNFLYATISDNGKGFDVQSLDTHTSSPSLSGHHISVSNTHKRINLLFGEPYGVSFQSIPMVKTTATICLPLLDSPPPQVTPLCFTKK